MRVKNWSKFQQYKDRSPPWLRLHRTLIDSAEYAALDPSAAKYLPLVWILASEREGHLPAASAVAFRLRLTTDQATAVLAALLAADFLEESSEEGRPTTTSAEVAEINGYASSRHIPDSVKQAVFARDEGKCRHCGCSDKIEYDHIIPVSRGGGSDVDNIQLLCRPCNRRKRATMPAVPTQDQATQAQPPRSLEAEKSRGREETDGASVATDLLHLEAWGYSKFRSITGDAIPALRRLLPITRQEFDDASKGKGSAWMYFAKVLVSQREQSAEAQKTANTDTPKPADPSKALWRTYEAIGKRSNVLGGLIKPEFERLRALALTDERLAEICIRVEHERAHLAEPEAAEWRHVVAAAEALTMQEAS
jgi:hypothetical protein